MNISEIFVRRPVATTLVMLAVALFGVVSYRGLAVSDLPTVDFPTITVSAALPGADPSTMAATVASPLERQFSGIAGIEEMTSSSTSGATTITLTFDLDRDLDGAAVDVQTAIAAAMPLLPATLSAPPALRKTNPADQPILAFVLMSNTLPMSAVTDYVETLLGPRISMVNNVAQVGLPGTQRYAVRVQVDPEKLKTQAIGLNDIDQALRDWNVNPPTGQLFGPLSTYTVHSDGLLQSPDDLFRSANRFGSIVLGYHSGRGVRLNQVANVIDSIENTFARAWLYTKTSREMMLNMTVQKQPGTNVIQVTDAVRAVLPGLQAQMPPSVHMRIMQDRSISIRQSFADIKVTMLITLVLVVGVMFLFLHSAPATIIPALALPCSILGTFTVMRLLNYSLDNLSLMALILSVGFVVDDAIVVLENIMRHLEAGESPIDAALNGSREIGFTVLAMTVSLAAVFIPVLFMSGILGRLFREFAVTISASILISGVVSLTLTPMLCSRFLTPVSAKRGLSRLMDNGFERLRHGYAWSLRGVLRFRLAVLVLFFVILAITVHLFGTIPKGFIPDVDNDTLNINIRASQGTSFYEMVGQAQRVGALVNPTPAIDAMSVTTGGLGGMNAGRIAIQLVPRAERPPAAQIAQQLRGVLRNLPGVQAFVNVPPALQVGAFQGNSNYNLMVESPDYQAVRRWAPVVEATVATLPEVQDVSTNLEVNSPQVDLVINRDKAAAVGLDASQISTVLNDGLGPKWSTTIYGPRTQYKVLVEIDPKFQDDAEALTRLGFKTPRGAMVPLESVVGFRKTIAPNSINHVKQLPAVAVSFSLKPGVSLGAAVDHMTAAVKEVLPPTVTTEFQGSAKAFQDSLHNLNLLLFIAIGVVYIVLGMLYENYWHPLTILSGLPSAGLGALVTLSLFQEELNIYSFVGLIMLIGIVKKNAIMQVDCALEQERQHGKSPSEAIYEGCLIRFRPIMMTTMAALLGSLPIALGYGSGGDARRPLGLAVVGGLLVSQLMTLYLTPVVYTYFADLGGRSDVATHPRSAPV